MMILTSKLTLLTAAVMALTSPTAAFAPTSLPSTETALNSRSSVDFCNEVDYSACVDELSDLLAETKDKLGRIKELAQDLKDLEVQDITLADLGSSPAAAVLRQAVSEAKAAVDAFGPDTVEARLAWKKVDEAAEQFKQHAQEDDDQLASDHSSFRYSAAHLLSHHYYNSIVDTKVLLDSVRSIDQLDALCHFVNVEKLRLHNDDSDNFHP